MSEYENIKTFLQKAIIQVDLREFLRLKKLKILFRGYVDNVISDLKGEEIAGTFYEKELQKKKKNQKEFRVEKVTNRKGNKLYVKWKGYDGSFNSWIDKKDIV